MLREPSIFRVTADETAPGSARRIIREIGLVPDARVEDVALAVSELVTNAVKHGNHDDGVIELRVGASGGTLRVEVADGGGDFEAWMLQDSPRSGGVGLRLVAQLASRMGAETKEGTVVWFEVDF